jgi:hypothetical protein
MKEKAFIYTHLGIGDIICMIGAVRYIATMYEKVYVVCKDRNKEIIRDFYSDLPKIILATVEDDSDLHPWINISSQLVNSGYDVYGCGFFNLKKQPSIYDFPNSFYDDLEIPREVRRTHFKVPHSEEGQKLFDSFQGRPYIVVHQNASNYRLPIVDKLLSQGETRLIVDLNENQVDAKLDPEGHALAAKAIFRPFTEYVKLFEGADELHMIDSSIFCFAMHLDLSRVKQRKYYIRPGGIEIDSFGVFDVGSIPHKQS